MAMKIRISLLYIVLSSILEMRYIINIHMTEQCSNYWQTIIRQEIDFKFTNFVSIYYFQQIEKNI